MKKLLLSLIVCFSTAITLAQKSSPQLPKIMVIPFTKDGEDFKNNFRWKT